MGAETHLVVIHGEVRHRATELEQLLAGGAVALVLLHGVLDRLLGEAVLQLEGCHRQAVDEQAEVERPQSLVVAVAELARDREAVLRVAFSGGGVAGRRCAVEKFDVMRPVLDPLAQHVDDAALADLALEASQELPARGAIVFQAQALEGIRLRLDEEGEKLRQIDRILAVVVVGAPQIQPVPPAAAPPSRPVGANAASQGLPVKAVQISRSRPRSLVSVVTPQPPRRRHPIRRWAPSRRR